jgi:hypothetical protein
MVGYGANKNLTLGEFEGGISFRNEDMVFLASKGELLGLKHEDIGDGSENFVRVVRRNNHIAFKRTDYQFKLAHKLCDMAIAICPVGWVRSG